MAEGKHSNDVFNSCNGENFLQMYDQQHQIDLRSELEEGNVDSTGSEKKHSRSLRTTLSFGRIIEHQIMIDFKMKPSRGFGFITFEREDAVENRLREVGHMRWQTNHMDFKTFPHELVPNPKQFQQIEKEKAPSTEFCDGCTLCSIVESIETSFVSNRQLWIRSGITFVVCFGVAEGRDRVSLVTQTSTALCGSCANENSAIFLIIIFFLSDPLHHI